MAFLKIEIVTLSVWNLRTATNVARFLWNEVVIKDKWMKNIIVWESNHLRWIKWVNFWLKHWQYSHLHFTVRWTVSDLILLKVERASNFLISCKISSSKNTSLWRMTIGKIPTLCRGQFYGGHVQTRWQELPICRKCSVYSIICS